MSCSQFGHAFTPYPRSKDLFCTFCGLQPTVEKVTIVESPIEKAIASPDEEDPYIEQAKEIIDKSALESLEQALNEAMSKYEFIPADVCAELLKMGLDYGPNLNVEEFERDYIAPLNKSLMPKIPEIEENAWL